MLPTGVNYHVRPEVLLNGLLVPASTWSVDVNSYSMSSTLEATIPRKPPPGYPAYPSFGTDMQNVRPYPFEIRCGYSSDGSGSPLVLERGFVDDRETEYIDDVPQISFTGRSEASLFQDIQISKPINRNQAGSAIIQSFFQKYAPNIPLTITATRNAETYAGQSIGDPVYAITTRARTAWDEMTSIALAAGLRLTVHAGRATYGPPTGDPVLPYVVGQPSGLLALNTRHSPRRSHNVKIILRSYSLQGGKSIYVVYGHSNADDGETFNFAVPGLNRNQAQQRVQAIYNDIALREFLLTATIFPSAEFVQTVSRVGANFSIALSGDIDPAEQLTYGVRQVTFQFDVTSKTPLIAKIVAGNINPVQEGSFLS